MHGTWKKALAPALAVAVSALSLSATAVPASASGTKPTYIIAYEGPLSGGNAQLGLNMEYSVELAINNANAASASSPTPFNSSRPTTRVRPPSRPPQLRNWSVTPR